jgi:hypothetical protein
VLNIDAASGAILQFSFFTTVSSTNKFNLALTDNNIGGYMSNFDDWYGKPYFAVFHFDYGIFFELYPT